MNSDFYYYKDQKGNYILKNGNEHINMGTEISFIYHYFLDKNNKPCGVLLKHGMKKIVNKLYNEIKNQYSNINDFKNKDEIFIFNSEIELEELNKVLSICDYVIKIHEKRVLQ